MLVEIEDGRFTKVELVERVADLSGTAMPDNPGNPRSTGDPTRLAGLTIPGLANDHSHAFHRALRGRTQRERGTFWTWREQMYAVAGRLDAGLLLRPGAGDVPRDGRAGIHVGEGVPLPAPPARRDAVRRAERDGHALRGRAARPGLRITLLDTCYFSSGFGAPPEGVQRRLQRRRRRAWAARAGDGPAAIHSVRAVPREQLPVFQGRAPLHVHLSEQVAENDACLAAYGVTPTRLLHEADLLGPDTTVVHATHLTDDDIELLGTTGTNVCITPTTERDLADGIGPGRAAARRGLPDHARQRQPRGDRPVRGDARAGDGRAAGHQRARALDRRRAAGRGDRARDAGSPTIGAIAVGQPADLVTLDTASPRTAGTGADEHTAAFAATAADVVQVVADGRVVYTKGDDEEIGRELDEAIGALWPRR